MEKLITTPNPRAKYSVMAFILGVLLVVIFGSAPSLRPSFNVNGEITRLGMPETIEIIMMSVAALILQIGRASCRERV